MLQHLHDFKLALDLKKCMPSLLTFRNLAASLFSVHSQTIVTVLEAKQELKKVQADGKDVYKKNLRELAQDGDVGLVKAQIGAGKGPDADATETGSTPLMMAAGN